MRTPTPLPSLLCLIAATCSLIFSGCDARVDTFDPNQIYAKRMELESDSELAPAVADTQYILARLFGTPDEPLWPEFLEADQDLANVVSVERLKQAAGPISSDENDTHFGLYRKHCIACHGTSGGGYGPSSRLLNPYPRDFRLGKFKTKSTPLGSKPTRADLQRTLHRGIPGTSMPSFQLLKEQELDVLVDYVIYLSVRGEVERRLLTEAALNLDYEDGERLLDPRLEESAPEEFAEQWNAITKLVERSVTSWYEAAQSVPEVSGLPEGHPLFGEIDEADAAAQERLAASIENGRKLFQGPVASCAKCHGMTAMGDGMTKDYDDWTKDWSVMVGLDPTDKTALKPMLDLGAHKPRNILPRNLRSGVYRGGERPIDLYYRITHGIEGTPMPAVAMLPDNPQGLSEAEVWDLVNYLLSLPHEAIGENLAEASVSDLEASQ